MGQQQTKEENVNYQNYKPNNVIQTVHRPSINQNPQYNLVQPNQPINPNTGVNIRPQYVPENKPKYKGGNMIYYSVISISDLKIAFNNNSIEGKYLNKNKFNDTIMSLLNLNVPSLHYTYLSEKLYEMLDESGDGKIQEDEYLQGMKKVFTNKEFRMRCNVF
jgi:hypothetical protein